MVLQSQWFKETGSFCCYQNFCSNIPQDINSLQITETQNIASDRVIPYFVFEICYILSS